MKKCNSVKASIKRTLVILSVSSFSVSMLWGCGRDSESSSVDEGKSTDIDTQVIAEDEIDTTAEITTDEMTTEETETAIEISASEYLADYPVPGDNIMVYFKLAPEIDFYPNAVADASGQTYDEYYTNSINNDIGSAEVVCGVEEESTAHVSFTCNPYYSIDWYKENADVGIFGDGSSTYSISEPEICENGFVIYTIVEDWVYDKTTKYVLEYQIDSNNTFQIDIWGFNDAYKEPIFQEELESILDYYRNVENPIFIVDKDAPVNIVQ